MLYFVFVGCFVKRVNMKFARCVLRIGYKLFSIGNRSLGMSDVIL